jgi:hypothetical protein
LVIFCGFFNVMYVVGIVGLMLRQTFGQPVGTTLVLFFLYLGILGENLTEVLILNPPKILSSSKEVSEMVSNGTTEKNDTIKTSFSIVMKNEEADF